MNRNSRPGFPGLREQVHEALDEWPDPTARQRLVALCSTRDLGRLSEVGRAVARCGRARRGSADAFLDRYAEDRRFGLRSAVLYARSHLLDDAPRAFVREMNRIASLPGQAPWPALMDAAYGMWTRAPRDMFRLLTPWLTDRNPRRRWAALHGLEVPARREPRSALKVLRLFRGERNLRVRRLLGHIFGQSLYPFHPEEALYELSRWLSDGAAAAPAVARFSERQLDLWFSTGRGSERQRRRLLRECREYALHEDPDVRRHARSLARLTAG